jgi:hypothetical protein
LYPISLSISSRFRQVFGQKPGDAGRLFCYAKGIGQSCPMPFLSFETVHAQDRLLQIKGVKIS